MKQSADNAFHPFGNGDIDIQEVIAEIASVLGSKSHILSRIRVCEPKSIDIIDGELADEMISLLEGNVRDGATALHELLFEKYGPFLWHPITGMHGRGSDGSNVTRHVGEHGRVSFHVFTRRVTRSEVHALFMENCRGDGAAGSDRLIYCHGLAQFAFDRLATRRHQTVTSSTITRRERECLQWCAEGKTSEDIGAILSLSTHTVNHYLISAINKLDAVNRTHAVAIAFRDGIFEAPDET
jgi:DNA-binding CsgD family transcriptional regulator